MLKLKIGENYLLMEYNTNQEHLIKHAIPYMMGCFKGKKSLAVALSPEVFNAKEIVKAMDELKTNKLYILQYIPLLEIKKAENAQELNYKLSNLRELLASEIRALKTLRPLIEIKVININAYEKTPAFKVSSIMMEHLKSDQKNILSVLQHLDTYKAMSKRYAAIPNEIRIIDNDLKKLSKATKVYDRKDTVESLSYLKLIDKVEKAGNNLKCYIHELPIYTSEKLGEFFAPKFFEENPYLFKTASYIYQGCHFKMPATIIEIDTNFRLHFIQTQDHTFDNMFRQHNWSGIGYPHFGDHGFCAGEFNDTMAHAKEYGLGYYFTCLKQYLTTANVRDLAGFKIWWYPIYNEQDELVYCAGFDILLNEYIRLTEPAFYEELKDLPWAQKVQRMKNYNFNHSTVLQYGCGNMSYSYTGEKDAFLTVCEKLDKDLYNKIMEGMKE